MQDRQLFEVRKLTNGLTVYHYNHEYPFNQIVVRIPTGYVHSTGDYAPGTAHLLEHLLLLRSHLYPEKYSFDRFIALCGGDLNAFTSPFDTSFELVVPTAYFKQAAEGLFAHVFDPYIEDNDIVHEISIVKNERDGRRWFPADNEVGYYMRSSWMYDMPSKRNLFGTNEDLAAMTPKRLMAFHELYKDTGIQVIIGGSADIESFCAQLETLELSTISKDAAFEPISWVQRDYHEHAFQDVSEYEYFFGSFGNTTLLPEEMIGLSFIGIFLTNPYHGVLYSWLRHEKGWLYGTHFGSDSSVRAYKWCASLSFSNREHLAAAKKQLWQKIDQGLGDKVWVSKEVDRRLGLELFSYQTLQSIVGSGMSDLETYNRIITEEEYRNYLERCRDIDFLRHVYDAYMAKEHIGEFCAVPKEE